MDRELEYADEYHELYMLGLLDGQEDIKQLKNQVNTLKNNRNEAVREIMYMIENCDISYYQGKKLENILMGDNK